MFLHEDRYLPLLWKIFRHFLYTHRFIVAQLLVVCLCLPVFLLALLLSINANVELWNNHSLFHKVSMLENDSYVSLYNESKCLIDNYGFLECT